MDLHTRKALRIYLQKDDHFHHSPSHDQADVVCEGSDNEQTEGEIQRKRSRYEQHAQRYMRGFMPNIQSARLRGPFAQSDGWSNPWQHQPPSPILTHNKSARANEKMEMEDPETSSISMVKSPSGSLSAIVGPDSSGWITAVDSTQHSSSRSRTSAKKRSYAQAPDEFPLAPADKTPLYFGKIERERRMGGAKRALDAQWLKGPYVSKRARWEDSDLATPTPNPHISGPGSQLWHAGQSKLGHSSNNQQSSSPSSIIAFRDIPRMLSQSQRRENHLASKHPPGADSQSCASCTPGVGNVHFDTYSQQQDRNDVESPRCQLAGPLLNISQQPQPRRNSLDRENQAMKPNEDSFVTEIVPASRNLEEFQFRKKRAKSRNTGPASDPQRHRIQLLQSTSAPTLSSKLMQDGIIGSPGPQQRNIQARAASVEEMRVDKSRRHNQVLLGVSLDEEERHSDEDAEDVLQSGPLNEWYQPASIKLSQCPEDAKRIWSKIMGEDISEKASPYQANDGLNTSCTSQQVLAGEGDSNLSLSFAADSIPFSPWQLETPHGQSESACSQSLPPPRSKFLQEESSAVTERPKTFDGMGIHDFSTQSYNTTPARPSRPKALRTSPVKSGQVNEEPTEGISTQEGIENVGDKILVSSTADPNTQRPDTPCDDKQEDSTHPSLHVPSTLRPRPKSSCPKEDVQLNMERDHLSLLNHQEEPSIINVTEKWTFSSGTLSNSDGVNSMSANTPPKHSSVISPTKQSPWAVVDVPPGFDTATVPTLYTTSICDEANTSPSTKNSPFMKGVEVEYSERQHVEHPMTPGHDNMSLHNGTITYGSPSIEPGGVQGEESLLDTQQLVEAATANPWTQSPTRKPSKKSGKRVSFAILFDDESEQVEATKRIVHSPPPPAISDVPHGENPGGEAIVASFKKHFNSFKSPRRLLSQESLSAWSPAVGAMAEAFLEADRDASLKEERSRASLKSSRYLKPSSEAIINSCGYSPGHDTSSSPNLFEKSPTREAPTNIDGSDFDMEGVLGEVAVFLGNWSVNSDVQKSRKDFLGNI
ncbi:hypothetical protein BJ875DRAFT_173626 [Amylocarpus encephaloides]|uniref:Uncharacterized protein n=1 Tax=Amylocarpus encephaloides TaxID=45428 RepID=A0A9P7YA30_9HELO|nr:hypothetical protein BJ875DRAFT_173626 [Amylocarpus encephaloides]